MALTVVAGVVLVTDPLSRHAVRQGLAAGSRHYQFIPRSLLSLIAAVTLLIVVITLVSSLVAAARRPGLAPPGCGRRRRWSMAAVA